MASDEPEPGRKTRVTFQDNQVEPFNIEDPPSGEGSFDFRATFIGRVLLLSNFLLMISICMLLPVQSPLFLSIDGIDGSSDNAGYFNSIALTLNSFCEFLTAGALGMLSDSYGRKPFLILSIFGWFVDHMAFIYAANTSAWKPTDALVATTTVAGNSSTTSSSPSKQAPSDGVFMDAFVDDAYSDMRLWGIERGLQAEDFAPMTEGEEDTDADFSGTSLRSTFALFVLIVTRVFAGLVGNPGIYMKAIIADSVPPEATAQAMGDLAVSTGLGIIGGPIVGLIINHLIGFRMCAVGAVCLAAVSIVLAAVMPESLATESRAPVKLAAANPIGVLSFLLSTPYLRMFAYVALVDTVGVQLVNGNLAIFCQKVFNAGPVGMGAVLMFIGGQICIISGAFLPFSLRKYGYFGTVQGGYIFTMAGLLALGFVSMTGEYYLLFPCFVIFCVGVIAPPTQSAMSMMCVDVDQQGMLQGALGSLNIIGRMTAPIISAFVWRFLAADPPSGYGMPETLWFVGAFCVLPGIVIAFFLKSALPPHVVLQVMETEAILQDPARKDPLGHSTVNDLTKLGGSSESRRRLTVNALSHRISVAM